jgi:transcriptional regulator with XRE-family HTH domain
MVTSKEKFKALVTTEKTNTVEKNKERIKNRARLRESQKIALKVLTKLDELGWNQKMLAKELGVSPQQVSKIVSGKENLTLETQVKLQEVLDIPILATYYEKKINDILQSFNFNTTVDYTLPKAAIKNKESVLFKTKQLKMEYNKTTSKYTTYTLAS